MTATRYANMDEARADGWIPHREASRCGKRDVSGRAPGGGRYVGYVYELADGTRSTTLYLTDTPNQLGRLGSTARAFRAEDVERAREHVAAETEDAAWRRVEQAEWEEYNA